MVNRDDYKLMLEKAVAELTEVQDRRAQLDAERDQLDARIAELKQGIMALAPLCGVKAQINYADLLPEYALLPPGLKEAVLSVLALVPADDYITPVQIRDSLSATGYEIKSKNILPSVHNVLKRLEKATPPEVESTDLDGKTGYRLVKKPGGTAWPVQPGPGSPPKLSDEIPGTVPRRYAIPSGEVAEPGAREKPKPIHPHGDPPIVPPIVRSKTRVLPPREFERLMKEAAEKDKK